jgi:hypothetical protein
MRSQNIPKPFDENDREKKIPFFSRLEIDVMCEKINKEKIDRRPSTPAEQLAYPITRCGFLHEQS